ncbi:xanthine dehydrogenase accessory protein XdhC [Roseiterribacter gracilis]|uniref:Xanthine dehydrogenase accessory protein XdhC n=1 Tax=Roseiterribacter gracilis TaxID=2812848 RepID=A0A8S8X7M9_9PROT|nr:xanthine dehydrogenase accessory protein XdhC [Rhodospirillales bacterium TMPK1]
MTLSAALRDRLARNIPTVLVTVEQALGSTPRDGDAVMLVDAGAIVGTIGGGRLEHEAIQASRALLRAGASEQTLDLALGPVLDQCCGGRMVLKLERAAAATLTTLEAIERNEQARRPCVLLFGAGHVGRALAQALSLLPFDVRWIDERAHEFPDVIPPNATRIVSDKPWLLVDDAPSGAAIVAVTHGHAQDFDIVDAALRRGDCAYVGMIGSDTKRVRFRRWFEREGGDAALLDQLTCPLGGTTKIDKRPPMIAALTAAELVRALAGELEPSDVEDICEVTGCGT